MTSSNSGKTRVKSETATRVAAAAATANYRNKDW
jgi:hypothetical protein